MKRFLLDVNVLIALIDPAHVHHEAAHEWFAREGHTAWATCPLTENGLLRIVGHPRYPNSPGSPAIVAEVLCGLRALPGHAFWPDDISLMDSSRIDAQQLRVTIRLLTATCLRSPMPTAANWRVLTINSPPTQ